jgi:hypothetical protein
MRQAGWLALRIHAELLLPWMIDQAVAVECF